MASEGQKPVSQVLHGYQEMVASFDDEEKDRVLGLISQARTLLSGVDGAADDLAHDLTDSEAKPDELAREDDVVESSEQRLATTLAGIREALGLVK